MSLSIRELSIRASLSSGPRAGRRYLQRFDTRSLSPFFSAIFSSPHFAERKILISMASLQSLPNEVLEVIADAIPPTELRRDVRKLVLCRRWYHVALPVFLRDLRLEDIYLSANSLERFPPSSGSLYRLICKRLKRLSIRLIGHPSWQIAYEPFIVPMYQRNLFHYEPEACEMIGKSSWSYNVRGEPPQDWTSYIPTPVCNEWMRTFAWSSAMEHDLLPWGKRINQCLRSLSENFAMFGALEEISFEASTEAHIHEGPRWNYLDFGTAVTLLSAIPNQVASLTLDLNGVELPTLWAGSGETHLCAILAPRLHDFETVRLRLRHICPSIFGVTACYDGSPLPSCWLRPETPEAGSYESTSDDSSSAESSSDDSVSEALHSILPYSPMVFEELKWQLFSLIIKLSLPTSPSHIHTPGSDSESYSYRLRNPLAGLCPEFVRTQPRDAELSLKYYMGHAASRFAKLVPTLGECIVCEQSVINGTDFISESGTDYIGRTEYTMSREISARDGGRRWQTWEYEEDDWQFEPSIV